ncbi:MAG: D-alanyl-D-alanine carboxypeptidase [Armatimonadetes bacterium]|nr:D-alanyl-D-alanine carboxypeptidase [Armatimonadota bacterium]
MAATFATLRGGSRSGLALLLVTFAQLCPLLGWAARDGSLGARMEALWQSAALKGAKIAAVVADPVTGRVLYERASQQALIPASNEKLPVTACALLLLGPDYRFRTQVFVGGAVGADGIVQGPIIVSGSADPTANADIFPSVAKALAQRGIRGCRGVLVDGVLTAARDDSGALSKQRLIEAFARFQLALVPGQELTPVTAAPIAIMEHASPPVAGIVAQINKRSVNWLADNLFRSLGWLLAGDKNAAGPCLRAFWARRGLPLDGVVFADGSGLSRQNRITAAFVVELLRYMYFCRAEWPAFAASLPVAGRDGTLASRMVRCSAEGRVWAKTGTMHDVCSLSGYAQTLTGRVLCFSIILNGFSCSQKTARDILDAAARAIVELGSASPELQGEVASTGSCTGPR